MHSVNRIRECNKDDKEVVEKNMKKTCSDMLLRNCRKLIVYICDIALTDDKNLRLLSLEQQQQQHRTKQRESARRIYSAQQIEQEVKRALRATLAALPIVNLMPPLHLCCIFYILRNFHFDICT